MQACQHPAGAAPTALPELTQRCSSLVWRSCCARSQLGCIHLQLDHSQQPTCLRRSFWGGQLCCGRISIRRGQQPAAAAVWGPADAERSGAVPCWWVPQPEPLQICPRAHVVISSCRRPRACSRIRTGVPNHRPAGHEAYAAASCTLCFTPPPNSLSCPCAIGLCTLP